MVFPRPALTLPVPEISFGTVYGNPASLSGFQQENAGFPTGSIIIREKNGSEASETPLKVIAMVKREKGFSPTTGDWEFLMFNGSDLKLEKRETVGSCSACHAQAQEFDWVFRDHLK